MLSRPSESNPGKLLLVEGNDDCRFFNAMCRHLEINDIAIHRYNGKDNLRNDLPERVINPAFQLISSLGIVRDADDSATSAFASVVSSLQKAGLPIPNAPLIPAERDGLRISILILPPAAARGELEDVCLDAIADSPDLQCVDSYLNCLNQLNPPIAANRAAKARLHAYLAVKPAYIGRQPALRLGEAADAGVWNWAAPPFQQITNFLRNL